jgi:uncharacterized protein YkwD
MAGVALMLPPDRADAPASSVAGSPATPSQLRADDAAFYAELRAGQRAAAIARRERAAWYAAVRGPTFEQVLVFFNVLASTAPPPVAHAPPPPPVAAAITTEAAAATVPAAPVTPVGVWTDTAFTQAVWDGVNWRRAQAGLAALSLDPALTRAASDYTVAMSVARWFSHTGLDGSSFVDRIVAAGFPFEGQLGEILAMGTNGWPAADVVQAWMDSPPHREQMLTPGYRLAGVACAFMREAGALTVRCAMEFAA